MVELIISAPGLMAMAFIASAIQRVAGLGFGIAMASFALATWEPYIAVYITSIIGVGVTLITMAQLWTNIIWRVIWPLLTPVTLFMCIGLAFSWAFGKQPLIWMIIQALGLMAMAFTIRPILARTQPTTSPWIAHPWTGGPITGFLSSTVGIPGPTVAPYFFTRGIVGTAFVASICPMFLLTAGIRMGLGTSTEAGSEVLMLSLVGSVFAVCGVLVGSLIAPFVPLREQRLMIVALIVASAAKLAWAFGESFMAYFLN